MKRQKNFLTMVVMAVIFVLAFTFPATAGDKGQSADFVIDGVGGVYKFLTRNKDLSEKEKALKTAETLAMLVAKKQGHKLEFNKEGFVGEKAVNSKSVFRLNLGSDNGQEVIIVTAVTAGDQPKYLAFGAFSSIEAVKKASTKEIYNTFSDEEKALIGPLSVQTSVMTEKAAD